MSPLAEFVTLALRKGEVLFCAPPLPARERDAEAAAVLARTFAEYRLTVPGPLLEFDEPTALAAAALVQQACWFLVSHDEPPEEVQKRLVMPGPPQSLGEHLSADLLLRFLPQVHQRARASNPEDPLVARLAQLLREWPLSGVLSSVEEEPATALDFHGHRGLWLLYAERWSRHSKPAWQPHGEGLEFVELVWAELGKDTSVLRAAQGDSDD